MKPTTAAAIINSVMWLAVAAAVIAGLILTGRLVVLWFFLIPAICLMAAKEIKERGGEDEAGGV